MTTSTKSTIAQLKQAIQAIAEELGVVEDWANGHRGHRETWLNAYAKAQAAQLEFRAAQAAAKEIETEVLTTETEQAIVDAGEGEMIILNKQELSTSLTNEIFSNGGFYLWLDSDKRSSGFSVGNNTYSYQVPNANQSIEGLAQVTEAIPLFMTQVENLINNNIYDCDGIGGLLDEESSVLYLDPVRHIADLGDALELAQENEELAIYALQSGICYSVFGSHNKIDDTKYHIDGEPSEISDNFLWYRVYDSETEAVVGYVAQG